MEFNNNEINRDDLTLEEKMNLLSNYIEKYSLLSSDSLIVPTEQDKKTIQIYLNFLNDIYDTIFNFAKENKINENIDVHETAYYLKYNNCNYAIGKSNISIVKDAMYLKSIMYKPKEYKYINFEKLIKYQEQYNNVDIKVK